MHALSYKVQFAICLHHTENITFAAAEIFRQPVPPHNLRAATAGKLDIIETERVRREVRPTPMTANVNESESRAKAPSDGNDT